MKARELMKNAIDETADVMIYILALSQQNNIDVSDSIKKKIEKNIKKYPAVRIPVQGENADYLDQCEISSICPVIFQRWTTAWIFYLILMQRVLPLKKVFFRQIIFPYLKLNLIASLLNYNSAGNTLMPVGEVNMMTIKNEINCNTAYGRWLYYELIFIDDIQITSGPIR